MEAITKQEQLMADRIRELEAKVEARDKTVMDIIGKYNDMEAENADLEEKIKRMQGVVDAARITMSLFWTRGGFDHRLIDLTEAMKKLDQS